MPSVHSPVDFKPAHSLYLMSPVALSFEQLPCGTIVNTSLLLPCGFQLSTTVNINITSQQIFLRDSELSSAVVGGEEFVH